MLSKQQIDEILEPTITGLGFEYVCSELASMGNSKRSGIIVRIFIDKIAAESEGQAKTGVTLDDCTVVSQHVSRVLDVEAQANNSSETKINLEVSSPGLDRPLIKIDHFKRFINKKVKVRLNTPINSNQRNVIGYIREILDDKQIKIESIDSKDVVYNIEFDNINKANIVPEW